MKSIRRKLIIAAVAIAIILCGLLYCSTQDSVLSLKQNDDIELTRTYVTAIKEIGQWEFLAVSDEELVDTVKKSLLSSSELIRIYYGTLRIGIDFSQCDDTWIRMEGDSIILDLPPVQLLDENFLDETRTQSFFETGTWTNKDRHALAERARRMMKKRCLSKQNMQMAQERAETEIRRFLELRIKN